MITRITAETNKTYNGKYRTYTWDRSMINNIIENIPKLIKLDGCWKNVKIHKKGHK